MSKQAFISFRNALIDALNKNEDWQRSKASGSADAYIKSDASAIIGEDRFVQYGLSYTPFIDSGTPKGIKPNVKDIFDWLVYRKYGLSYSTDKERWRLAALIARKHAKEGSFKFRGNQTDVFATAIEQAKPRLFEAIEEQSRINFDKSIADEIKRINDLPR